MMSFIDLKDAIPKLLKEVSFVDYLLHRGYHPVESKNIETFKCFVLKNDMGETIDVLYINRIGSMESFYSLVKGDQGNVLEFIKNRIEDSNRYDSFSPEKDSLIEATRELIVYVNENDLANQSKLEQSKVDNFKLVSSNGYSSFFNLVPLKDIKFFKEYSIDEDTLLNPIFENRIYNSRGLNYNGTLYEKAMNVVYPLRDSRNNEVGLYYNNLVKIDQNLKFIDFFSDFTNLSGIWTSNKAKLNVNNRLAVTLVSSPIEALAHNQLFENKNQLQYVCLFDINFATLNHFYQIILSENSLVHFAKNVAIEDMSDELKILLFLLNKKYQVSLLDESNDRIKFSILQNQNDGKLYDRFLKKIASFNKHYVIESSKLLGEIALKYVKEDLIKVSSSATNIKNVNAFYIDFPKNIKSLYNMLKILADSFPLPYNISIEKSQHLKWTKQIQKNKSKKKTLSLDQMIQQEAIYIHKTR